MIAGQLHLWFQLQFHIYVTPFEDPLHPWLQSHLCLILDHEGGSTPSPWLQINICVVPFEGPLQLLIQCQSMCHIRLWRDNSIFDLQLWDPYLYCTAFKGPLHLHLRPHLCPTLEHRGPLHLLLHSNLCFTLDYGGINFISMAPDPYLCCVFLGSAFHLHASVQSMFHIRLCVGNQHHLQLQMQMQIHICVVPFEDPLHLPSASPIYVSH